MKKIFMPSLLLLFITNLYAEEGIERPRYLLTMPTAYTLKKGEREWSLYTTIWKENFKRKGIASYSEEKSTWLYFPPTLSVGITDNLELMCRIRIWRESERYYYEYHSGILKGKIGQDHVVYSEWRPYFCIKGKPFQTKDIAFSCGWEALFLLPFIDSTFFLIMTKSFLPFDLTLNVEWGQTWLGYNRNFLDGFEFGYTFLSLNTGVNFPLKKNLGLIGELNTITLKKSKKYSKIESAFTVGSNIKISSNINFKLGFLIPIKWKEDRMRFFRDDKLFYPICILGISYQRQI